MIVATGDEAVQYWREKATDTTVSFAVNHRSPVLDWPSLKGPRDSLLLTVY